MRILFDVKFCVQLYEYKICFCSCLSSRLSLELTNVWSMLYGAQVLAIYCITFVGLEAMRVGIGSN